VSTGAAIWDFFRARGYSPAATAGIIGNFQQESSLDPNAPGGGLDQGEGSRYHPGDLAAQLRGILGELEGPERATARAIRSSSDPRAAARVFSQRFERPGMPMLANRERYAAEALQRYGGRAVRSGAGQRQVTTTSLSESSPAAQTADLVAFLQSALAPQQTAPAPLGLVRRPGTAPSGPRVPQAPETTSQGDRTGALLALISKIGQDAPQLTQHTSTTSVPAGATSVPGVSHAVASARGGHGFTPAAGTNYSRGVLPQISQRLNALGQALGISLSGISGYRTPAHSVAVGGFADDPHTKGLASDTPGIEKVPKAVLNRYGLERPFPGAREADHIQLLHSVNRNGGY
jgi:Phage tail lysozyme